MEVASECWTSKDLRQKELRKVIRKSTWQKKMGYKDRALYAKRENGIVNIGADELYKIARILEIEDMCIFFKLNVP